MYDSERKGDRYGQTERQRNREIKKRLGSDKMRGYKRDISKRRDEVLVEEDDGGSE